MSRIVTHPGEVLREDFMIPLGLSANALSRALDVPPNRITSIIADEHPRAITPELWLNLQQAYDLSVALTEHGARIADVVRPRAA
jgi:addiction module HigA family antidote